MPLESGSGRAVVSRNIADMIHAGHPQNQAVAASLANARRHPDHMADGGMSESSLPWWTKRDASDLFHTGGLLDSHVPGRTDRLPLSVAADSHVIPADVVSGLGQGNTMAGAAILDKILRMGPYGTPLPRGGSGGSSIPRPPRPLDTQTGNAGPVAAEGFKAGGRVARILAAGGEYVVPAWKVHELGAGDLDKGHTYLRTLTKNIRAATLRFLKNAPEPKK